MLHHTAPRITATVSTTVLNDVVTVKRGHKTQFLQIVLDTLQYECAEWTDNIVSIYIGRTDYLGLPAPGDKFYLESAIRKQAVALAMSGEYDDTVALNVIVDPTEDAVTKEDIAADVFADGAEIVQQPLF